MKGIGTPSDVGQAIAAFTGAARAGNLLAAYNLAVLHLRGLAGESKGPAACRAAVSHLKKVAERAWPALAEGADDFSAGDYEWALLNYLKAAEWGSELGQSNAAWMLVEGHGYEGPRGGAAAVAMLGRAAAQGNAAALVTLGDSFWYGKGVARDWARAGRVYAEAARHRLAQALFNLGYMHQHGAGAPKDLHLAKRYYDRTAETAPDARLAAFLALAGLHVQSWWEQVQPSLPPYVGRIGSAILYGILAPSKVNETERVGASPARLEYFHHRSHPSHGGSFGGQLRRIFSLNMVSALFDALDNSFDMRAVVWLALLLVVVMWRRRALRNNNNGVVAAQAQAPPNVVNDNAGAGDLVDRGPGAMEARAAAAAAAQARAGAVPPSEVEASSSISDAVATPPDGGDGGER